MLCRAGIPTFKAPAFRAVYDLIAINPNKGKSATVQVKSRFETDCDRSFLVKELRADFFAFVFLNTGKWDDCKRYEDAREPEFYIVPRDKVNQSVDSKKKMPKFLIKQDDPDLQSFRNGWDLVAQNIGINIETLVTGDE